MHALPPSDPGLEWPVHVGPVGQEDLRKESLGALGRQAPGVWALVYGTHLGLLSLRPWASVPRLTVRC